jgi:hypothetical protein
MAKSTISNPLGFANYILDVLFRVIPIIRPALSTDRYERAVLIVLSFEEEFKQACSAKLKNLFPALSSELHAHLVSASLLRLRFFQYAANYGLKFSGPTSAEQEQENPALLPLPMPAFVEANFGDTDSIASKADENLDPFSQEGPGDDIDTRSVKSAIRSTREMKYKYPTFPEESENGLRECFACHLTLPLPNKDIWK